MFKNPDKMKTAKEIVKEFINNTSNMPIEGMALLATTECEQLMEDYAEQFKNQYVMGGRLPHRCPVCSGNGKVPSGFYNQTSGVWSGSSTSPENCKSCSGTGIVWG